MAESNQEDRPLATGEMVVSRAVPVGVTQQVNVKSSTDDCRRWKKMLKQFYQSSRLSGADLLDLQNDLPIDEYFCQLQLKTTYNYQSIEIEEIFDQVSDKKPLRILIDGAPGFGKTTLATKLTYDWATEKNYIKHFKLVLSISLKQFQHQSIIEIIERIGEECGVEKQSAIKIVNEHQRDTLFIIDELDRFPLREHPTILELLYKQRFSESCVIVLTRPGFEPSIEHNPISMRNYFRNLRKQKDFYDKPILLLGIKNDEEKRKFVTKIASEKSAVDLIQKSKTISNLDFFDSNSPMLLTLWTAIALQRTDEKVIITQTKTYEQTLNFIIKNGCHVEKDFDLFHFDASDNRMQHLFEQFGKLSLEKIIANDLRFQRNDLTDQICRIGFLIHRKRTYFFTQESYYEALHPTFVEFVAAFAQWINFKRNKPNVNVYINYSQQATPYQSRGTLHVQQFFHGLILSDLIKLCYQSETYTLDYSQNVPTILRECQLASHVNESYLDVATAKRDLKAHDIITGSNYTRIDVAYISAEKESSHSLKGMLKFPSVLNIDTDQHSAAELSPIIKKKRKLDHEDSLDKNQSVQNKILQRKSQTEIENEIKMKRDIIESMNLKLRREQLELDKLQSQLLNKLDSD